MRSAGTPDETGMSWPPRGTVRLKDEPAPRPAPFRTACDEGSARAPRLSPFPGPPRRLLEINRGALSPDRTGGGANQPEGSGRCGLSSDAQSIRGPRPTAGISRSRSATRPRTRRPPTTPHAPACFTRASPRACRRDYRQFLPVLAHFGLLLGVFRVYRVETRVFQDLAMLAMAALPVHYLTPYRWKKPLFVAVSILGHGLDLRRRLTSPAPS